MISKDVEEKEEEVCVSRIIIREHIFSLGVCIYHNRVLLHDFSKVKFAQETKFMLRTTEN